jgi:hypothetical protein
VVMSSVGLGAGSDSDCHKDVYRHHYWRRYYTEAGGHLHGTAALPIEQRCSVSPRGGIRGLGGN